MVHDDQSMTHAFLLILTFLTVNVGLSIWKQRSKLAARLLEDLPLVLLEHGHPIKDRMDRARVDEEDILEVARGALGLRRLDELEYAVLERSGNISVIPRRGGG